MGKEAIPSRTHGHTHDINVNQNQQSDSTSTVGLFPTHLHQHPSERRRSAACGTRRRCRICNASIPHRSHYFHCSQKCRFAVCTACFSPSARCATNGDSRQRGAVSEPPVQQTVADTNSSVDHGVYGRSHFTRYANLTLEAFTDKVNGLISQNVFAGIGVPQIRIKGTTAWGAWVRINHRHSAFGRRPQLLCGILFHAANRRLTFHGDASCLTRQVLPLFGSWTSEHITGLSAPHGQAVALDAVSQPDPDSQSSGNSEVDCAMGGREQRAEPNDAASPHTPAIQELQAQVMHLSTMITKVLQFIDEHLATSSGLPNRVGRTYCHLAKPCCFAAATAPTPTAAFRHERCGSELSASSCPTSENVSATFTASASCSPSVNTCPQMPGMACGNRCRVAGVGCHNLNGAGLVEIRPAPADCVDHACWACCSFFDCPSHANHAGNLVHASVGSPCPPPPPPPPPQAPSHWRNPLAASGSFVSPASSSRPPLRSSYGKCGGRAEVGVSDAPNIIRLATLNCNGLWSRAGRLNRLSMVSQGFLCNNVSC